ncbi:hypothetical protein [Acetanaerobacterium elongatum]|uniref:Uncharacterized protein n=1 Tax=Acetanaerobacterium elongatum TaxID=258515 RepID=A0A1G9YZB0_9FIRM|nr:hypothetical protein [Acetanaerobacterium elongatum]SDN14267.1 hypothetical protein SAMN05192585_11231 [Acetanaerobacterium elongatum]
MSMLFDRGRVQIELGSGDVNIHFGGNKDTGVIGLVPAKAHPIGEKCKPIVTNVREAPVSFYFHDPKSIDVLISACEKVKAIMATQAERTEHDDAKEAAR